MKTLCVGCDRASDTVLCRRCEDSVERLRQAFSFGGAKFALSYVVILDSHSPIRKAMGQEGVASNPSTKGWPMTWTELDQALARANEAGLFEILNEDVHPDCINAFCDAVLVRANKESACSCESMAEACEQGECPVHG